MDASVDRQKETRYRRLAFRFVYSTVYLNYCYLNCENFKPQKVGNERFSQTEKLYLLSMSFINNYYNLLFSESKVMLFIELVQLKYLLI